jgi:hypothetical protein
MSNFITGNSAFPREPYLAFGVAAVSIAYTRSPQRVLEKELEG